MQEFAMLNADFGLRYVSEQVNETLSCRHKNTREECLAGDPLGCRQTAHIFFELFYINPKCL